MTTRSIHIGPEGRAAFDRIREITAEIRRLEAKISALQRERGRQMDIWRRDSSISFSDGDGDAPHRPLGQEPVDPEPAPVESDAD